MAIPSNTVTMHHVGTTVEDIAMGIRSEDFRYLADVLNGLYSDTIAAPIREYSTNAWDSHVAAGVTRPIEISLPTADDLTFTVQDFGLGMSVDDLRNTYAMYGASDKRDSNEVAGQLGLGSKSGLSYAEAFTITAVKGGVKTIAMSTKDDHGLGVIKVLDTVGTDEPNGVRITIPVDRSDMSDFRQKAIELFQFWAPGSVIIDGEAPAEPSWLATALRLDEDTWVVRPDSGLYRSYVIMGNVAYPVPDAQVVGANHRSVSRRFVARLNIGDVDFVPSREEVKHTRHTDATLAELGEHIGANFNRALARANAKAPTRWAETLLKTLWMDRNLSLRASQERPIWTYNPSGWGRKAQGHVSYSISHLAQAATWVITGFSAKNISATARERLVEFASNKTTFVVIPAGVQGTGQLEGRPNVVTWDEIVGATVKPKADRAARGPKEETLYTVVGASSMTAPQLAAISGKVLYLNPDEGARHGTLDATVVKLYSVNQLARVRRFVPGIVYYSDEVQAQRKAALAAITPHDKRIVQARTLSGVFASFDPAKVDDPELAEHIRLSKAADTDTLSKAKALGIGVSHTPLPDYAGRYPLVGNGYYHASADKALAADRVFYVNAKYASIIEAAAAEAVAS